MSKTASLVDKIANNLQAQIATGALKPGARVPAERHLCATLGVSRATVREALQALAVRGAISRRGRSVIVNDPRDAALLSVDLPALAAQVSIKQLYEARKLIEVQIAGYAALRATASEIKAIWRSLDGAPAVGSPHRAFHGALAAAVHNPALVQLYESGSNIFFRLPFFWKMFDHRRVQKVRARRHEMARRWHEEIARAIEQKDVEEAKGAMFQHLDIMEKDLLNQLHERDSHNGHSLHPALAQSSQVSKSTSHRKSTR